MSDGRILGPHLGPGDLVKIRASGKSLPAESIGVVLWYDYRRCLYYVASDANSTYRVGYGFVRSDLMKVRRVVTYEDDE